jgi:hypothetical protein
MMMESNQINTNPVDPVIMDRFKKLPKDLQRHITDSGWEVSIRKIGKERNLIPEKIYELEVQTFLTLFGLIHTLDYPKVIKTKVGIEKEKADAIASRIDNDIFSKVRFSLEKAFETDPEVELDKPTVETKSIKPPLTTEELPSNPQPLKDSGILKKMSTPTTAKKESYSLDPYREPIDLDEKELK